ncbi:Uncharacterized protein PBTT_07285 [Plasmodiophora brassicae]|uniref:Uncharacterized protein n=1 Tax=Plasmodiophora brassicae TaxID=37360 RepID=A0A0G4J867_PLABS|nr:hypothetical protein PBRA_009371 [Plasmodiophora brassicae]SPQ99491.1 unnamed protein product [Plasmodiophora brassicae]
MGNCMAAEGLTCNEPYANGIRVALSDDERELVYGAYMEAVRAAYAGCMTFKEELCTVAALLLVVVQEIYHGRRKLPTGVPFTWTFLFADCMEAYLRQTGRPGDSAARIALRSVLARRVGQWSPDYSVDDASAAIGAAVLKAVGDQTGPRPQQILLDTDEWLKTRITATTNARDLIDAAEHKATFARRASTVVMRPSPVCAVSRADTAPFSIHLLSRWITVHLRLREPAVFRSTSVQVNGEVYDFAGSRATTSHMFAALLHEANDARVDARFAAVRAYLDVRFFCPFGVDGNEDLAVMVLDSVLLRGGWQLPSMHPIQMATCSARDRQVFGNLLEIVVNTARPVIHEPAPGCTQRLAETYPALNKRRSSRSDVARGLSSLYPSVRRSH